MLCSIVRDIFFLNGKQEKNQEAYRLAKKTKRFLKNI